MLMCSQCGCRSLSTPNTPTFKRETRDSHLLLVHWLHGYVFVNSTTFELGLHQS
jgi:hypothetical protein